MRWEKHYTKDGAQRIKTCFLIFPEELERPDGVREVRWLEYAKIKQYYVADCEYYGWYNEGWAD